MKNVDPAKIFVVAMSVLIVGLGIMIIVTYVQMRAYENAYDTSHPSDYVRLAEAVEVVKAYKEREDESASIEPDNPITYIYEQARTAGISEGDLGYAPQKPRSHQRQYTDRHFRVTFNDDVDRRRLAQFLFHLETGSSLLTVTQLDLGRYSKTANRNPDADLWRPTLDVGYRTAYVDKRD